MKNSVVSFFSRAGKAWVQGYNNGVVAQYTAQYWCIGSQLTISHFSNCFTSAKVSLGVKHKEPPMSVQRCGDFSKAMDYLMSGDEDGVFQPSSDQRKVVQEVRRKPTPRYAEKRFVG